MVFRILIVIFFTLGFIGCSTTEEPSQPNIIVILADDAGYADFGFMGCKDLPTPNLDKLAGSGVVFSDAHTSATVCAPSRAGLLTGRYQQRFGFECNGTGNHQGLPFEERTLADVLKTKGYRTIAIGKWHQGEVDGYLPNQRGFDEFYGFLSGARTYFFNPQVDREESIHALRHNERQVDFAGYLTDVFGDKAVEFIERHKEEPFFMYLSFNAVHTPMEAKEADLKKFEGHPRQYLAAMTWSMDENIGKVIQKLEEENLAGNTLVFFLSDNGGANNNQSSVAPLKGWKGNKFEGGHRVPFVLSWPDQLKGGQKYPGLTSSLDIFATAIAAAGLEHSPGKPIDGKDLLPYLKGEKEGAPHSTLFWRKDKMAAARAGSHKLIRLDGYGFRMYDLDQDLGEKTDLSQSDAEQFNRMTGELEEWERGTIPPLWVEEDYWNEITYEIHQALMENRPPHYTNPRELNQFKAEKAE